jgi:hypothetical protein
MQEWVKPHDWTPPVHNPFFAREDHPHTSAPAAPAGRSHMNALFSPPTSVGVVPNNNPLFNRPDVVLNIAGTSSSETTSLPTVAIPVRTRARAGPVSGH